MDKKIGFIGQGWIGKNYADDFEERGYQVTRYSMEEPYIQNKEKISECDIVFIAVPTPTTLDGFDDSIVRNSVKLVGKSKIAVIKSTILPGTTESIQLDHPDIFLFHSPEFLSVSTAHEDARHPQRNIIGMPINNEEYDKRAKEILSVLPQTDFEIIVSAKEAELYKYLRNCFFYTKVIYMNMIYDLAKILDCKWESLREIMANDPWIGNMHIDPVHKSGRGAGGNCFIKDFAALKNFCKDKLGDELIEKIMSAYEDKNIELLLKSQKDLNLLRGVYGEKIINNHGK
jgi:UDPglucose 6-dehydrogenase